MSSSAYLVPADQDNAETVFSKAGTSFVVTKEYRRFTEFCDACRRSRYIGLCYGPPGVGKTLSARHYANWDKVERCYPFAFDAALAQSVPLPEVTGSHAVFYTSPVVSTPGQVERAVRELRLHLTEIASAQRCRLREEKQEKNQTEAERRVEDPTDLILVDEADRLKMAALEQMRDIFDRGQIGLVLIGMPGLEKRLSRYPQLYSRVGFVHAYRPLGEAEMRFLLQQQWHIQQQWQKMEPMKDFTGEGFSMEDFTDAEALAAVIRITGGNWRLLHRLMSQVECLLRINELHTITKEVVEAARENLIIGQT